MSAIVESSLWGGNTLLDGPKASRDIAQDGTHVLWLVTDLLVGEAQGREPGDGVRLIAQVVASLLGGSAVMAQAVGLDDQTQVRPEEVDLEAIDPDFRLWRRQADVSRHRQKETLEARTRETEGAPVEPGPQTGHPWLTAVIHERRPKSRGREEIEPIRLVNHALHGHPVVTDGEINQGLHRTGYGNVIERPDRTLLKPAATMDADAWSPPIPSRADRHLYLLAVLRPDSK
jgi:hypothetical protein